MTDRKFRFGIVAGRAQNSAQWTTMAQRAEELGYNIILVPDTLATLSPFPALAAAAAGTTSLRVGSYVLSAANRTPAMVAWETSSLGFLTNGRFELGLGAGRPAAASDAAALGIDYGNASNRLQRLENTIHAVKESGQPPRILVATAGPKAMELAAREADTIALGLPPQTTEEELAAKVNQLRTIAGDRFDALELQTNFVTVSETPDQIPEWVSRMVGGSDPRAMAAAGGMAFLTGTPSAMKDQLRRRRDDLGISYVAVNAMFMEQLAPIVEELAGT